ncbi:hypothetical protein KFK09_028924 [Dendrobium nobile]|uniref:Uncharacterized protein n=1 Tax=Dendrobium nobile TaxID=94219 RepID=A0A8T3A931_DENNO|nr:hypothetical protein KFK09_028924 [Dendrobium nobile]
MTKQFAVKAQIVGEGKKRFFSLVQKWLGREKALENGKLRTFHAAEEDYKGQGLMGIFDN